LVHTPGPIFSARAVCERRALSRAYQGRSARGKARGFRTLRAESQDGRLRYLADRPLCAPQQPKVSRQFGPQTWSDFQRARARGSLGAARALCLPCERYATKAQLVGSGRCVGSPASVVAVAGRAAGSRQVPDGACPRLSPLPAEGACGTGIWRRGCPYLSPTRSRTCSKPNNRDRHRPGRKRTPQLAMHRQCRGGKLSRRAGPDCVSAPHAQNSHCCFSPAWGNFQQ
jgi:hypothetical protein